MRNADLICEISCDHVCLVFVEDVLPENAYLCSGLDLYLTYEPDLMSSMALVHSRIRRVYFKHRDAEAGALISGRGHIHSLRALNHHYRVFQMHGETEKAGESPPGASAGDPR